MTRTNRSKCMETPSELVPKPGAALREAVRQAMEQERLTFGVHECARLLEVDPFNTMLCVLPESTNELCDVSVQIKHMLMEAFCTEYDIRVLKVDNAEKLAKLVSSCNQDVDKVNKRQLSNNTSTYTDVDCLLIQYPKSDPSEEDEIIAEYCKTCLFANDNLHTCVISLPD